MSLSILMKKQILQLSLSKTSIQSHHIEVVQGDIFMEQKIRFGLGLCQLAIQKKMGADYDRRLSLIFHVFRDKEIIKNVFKDFVVFAIKSCIK